MHVVPTMTEPERGLSTEVYSRNGKQMAPFYGYTENVLSSSPFTCSSPLMSLDFTAGSGKSLLA